MKKYRWLALCLAVVMCFGMLAGCGGSGDAPAETEAAGETEAAAEGGDEAAEPASGDQVTIKFVHKFPEEQSYHS